MRKNAFLAILFSLVLLVGSSFSGLGQSPLATTADPPIEVNLSAGYPITLDPTYVGDTSSFQYIEQLFAGLVDVDDDTSEIVPELAQSWSISDSGTVYTFTLRTDAYWSDGTPITAQDVRYGILRSLEPGTSGLYYVLFVIKNAEPYYNGDISDPNAVGVQALDNHTLQIELEYPSAQALYILSQPPARPVPVWAIAAHGDDWTQPRNIVTSGAYRLTEWVQDDHITMEKNAGYFNASQVQIEKINFVITDIDTAWQMYQNDQLDTAELPVDTPLDPILRQALHIDVRPCSYYYGFNVSMEPFDDPLVRQAFASAIDRRGIINNVLNGIQQPALTFSPPGVFGHVDGYLEGIGLPYRILTAQSLLAQAGYPGGQGFPAVTLTVHQNPVVGEIAQYAINTWQTVLGVSITLETMPWSPDYLDYIGAGNAQFWTLGWCADYPDAYNFLYDGVVPGKARFGGWSPPDYTALLAQAAREPDDVQRAALYKQAEEILVETETAMAPIYYATSAIAAKAHLERTYPATAFDIADWRITTVSQTVDPSSPATVTSYSGDTTIQVPAGSFTDTVTLTHQPTYAMPPAGDMATAGEAFEVTAVFSDTGQTAQLDAGSTISITMTVDPEDVQVIDESTLALYIWDGSQWQELPTQTVGLGANSLDPKAVQIIATSDQLGIFALLGETNRVYLPFAVR